MWSCRTQAISTIWRSSYFPHNSGNLRLYQLPTIHVRICRGIWRNMESLSPIQWITTLVWHSSPWGAHIASFNQTERKYLVVWKHMIGTDVFNTFLEALVLLATLHLKLGSEIH